MTKELIIKKIFPDQDSKEVINNIENKISYEPNYRNLIGKLNSISKYFINNISGLTFNKFNVILHICEDSSRNINDFLTKEAKSQPNIIFYKMEGNVDESSMLNTPITILYNKNLSIKNWYIGTKLIKIKNIINLNKIRVNYSDNLSLTLKNNKIEINFISYDSLYKYGALSVAGTAAAAGTATAVAGTTAVATAAVATAAKAATNLGNAVKSGVTFAFNNVKNYGNLWRIIFNKCDNDLNKVFKKLTGGASISNMIKSSNSDDEFLLFKNIRKYYEGYKSKVFRSYSYLHQNVDFCKDAIKNWFRTILEIYILQEIFKRAKFNKHKYNYNKKNVFYDVNGRSVFIEKDDIYEKLEIHTGRIFIQKKTYLKPDQYFYKFDKIKINDLIDNIKSKLPRNITEIYLPKNNEDNFENIPDNYFFFKIHEPDIAKQLEFLLNKMYKLSEKIYGQKGNNGDYNLNMPDTALYVLLSFVAGDFNNFFSALTGYSGNLYPQGIYSAISSFKVNEKYKSGLLLLIILGQHWGMTFGIGKTIESVNKFANSLKNVIYSPDYVYLIKHWHQLTELMKNQTLYLKGFSISSHGIELFTKDQSSSNSIVNNLYFENINSVKKKKLEDLVREKDTQKIKETKLSNYFNKANELINVIAKPIYNGLKEDTQNIKKTELTNYFDKAKEYISIIDILKNLDFIDFNNIEKKDSITLDKLIEDSLNDTLKKNFSDENKVYYLDKASFIKVKDLAKKLKDRNKYENIISYEVESNYIKYKFDNGKIVDVEKMNDEDK